MTGAEGRSGRCHAQLRRRGTFVDALRTRRGDGHELTYSAPSAFDYQFAVPTDAQCDGTPIVSFSYMNATTHTFQAYNPASPPAAPSIASTTTDQGMTVPYIVCSEHGAMDCGLYDVSVLADPSAGWAPWTSQPGWNHKVLYQFGGGTAP